MESTQQQIQDATAQAQTQTQQQVEQQINKAFDKLQPQIESVVFISALFMAAWILLHIWSAVRKRRIENAILRMDENLQKLVKASVPVTVETEEQADSTPVEQSEQK